MLTNVPVEHLSHVSPYGEIDEDELDNVDEGEELPWAYNGQLSHLLSSNSNYYTETRNRVLASKLHLPSLSELVSLFESPEAEEVFRSCFGDHVKIVATRDGFSVTDYDHD